MARDATDDASQPPESRKEILMSVSGYCLKCKKQVEIVEPTPITMKNGKPATTGTCPECSTKIFKIGKAT